MILTIIITISVVAYLADQLLEFLNYKAQRTDIPAEVAAFYNKAKYSKSLEYQNAKTKLSFVSTAVSFVASISMLSFGGFGYVDSLLRPYLHNEIVLALVFFAVIFIISDLISLPFQLYSTFVIEERF